jgi:hypothetical protein
MCQASGHLAVADRIREGQNRSLTIVEHIRLPPVGDRGQFLLAELIGHKTVVVPLIRRRMPDSRAQDHKLAEQPRCRHQIIAQRPDEAQPSLYHLREL